MGVRDAVGSRMAVVHGKELVYCWKVVKDSHLFLLLEENLIIVAS